MVITKKMKKEKTTKANEPDDPEVVLVTETENRNDNDDRLITISLKISHKLLTKLDAYAVRQRLSRSEVIRFAIEELLRNEGVF